jgi:hypothetical protein
MLLIQPVACELGGYAAPLLFLPLLTTMWGCRHKCRLRWVTDSKAAIAKVSHSKPAAFHRRKQPDNADFLAIILEGERSTRQKVKPVWTKGHQSATQVNVSGRWLQDIRATSTRTALPHGTENPRANVNLSNIPTTSPTLTSRFPSMESALLVK